MTATRLEGPRPERPPERAIIYSTTPRHRRGPDRRPGLIATSVLECAHITDTNARERRRGRMTCFSCYYQRAACPMGAEIVAEQAALTKGH